MDLDARVHLGGIKFTLLEYRRFHCYTASVAVIRRILYARDTDESFLWIFHFHLIIWNIYFATRGYMLNKYSLYMETLYVSVADKWSIIEYIFY